MIPRIPTTLLLSSAALALCSCLAAQPTLGTMCQETKDCSGNQVCDKGVCWGDPPDTSAFAAVLIPPANRPDLAPAELRTIRIAADGTISGLEFPPTVRVHGRIVVDCKEAPSAQCEGAALVPAQVTIERESTFVGGPQYRRTVLTNTEVGPTADSFSIPLPQDGETYRVTVLVDQASLDAQASAATEVQAPPFSTTVTSSEDTKVLWEVGRADALKSITGCIANATGSGSDFSGMHVSALGRWSANTALTLASSVVMSDVSGCFALSVPIDMLDEFDIVVKPAPGVALPTLRLSAQNIPDPANSSSRAFALAPLIMPNAANPVVFQLAVEGISSGGAAEPIPGATLRFATLFKKSEGETRDVLVRYIAQASSSPQTATQPGIAQITLFPGSSEKNRGYDVQVVTPPDSEFSSAFARWVEVGTGERASVLPGITLKRRVAVAGMITKNDASALSNTPIAVHPSPLLRRVLTNPDDRAILDNLQFPSQLTGNSGEFLLWLDPDLLGLMARYDFELAPSNYSSAPRWIFQDLSLDTSDNLSSVDLGELRLPAASYARGEIRDSDGRLTPGAELRWYQLPAADACSRAGLPTNCGAPAKLLGIWESDDTGSVVAVLPVP